MKTTNAGRPEPEIVGDHFEARLGRRIRKARQRQGLSVVEAVQRTNGKVSVTAWRYYERGLSEPMLSNFLAVCDALGVPHSKLLKD